MLKTYKFVTINFICVKNVVIKISYDILSNYVEHRGRQTAARQAKISGTRRAF